MLDLKLLDKEFAKKGSLPLVSLSVAVMAISVTMVVVVGSDAVVPVSGFLTALFGIHGYSLNVDKKERKKFMEMIEKTTQRKEE